jgi:hypothetical protein
MLSMLPATWAVLLVSTFNASLLSLLCCCALLLLPPHETITNPLAKAISIGRTHRCAPTMFLKFTIVILLKSIELILLNYNF